MNEQPTGNSSSDGGFRFALTCDRCGAESGTVEVVPPGELPEQATQWSEEDRTAYLNMWPGDWRVIYAGMARGSGQTGAPLSAEETAKLRALLGGGAVGRIWERYRDIGWCPGCGRIYCRRHWYAPGSTMHCPRGHRFRL